MDVQTARDRLYRYAVIWALAFTLLGSAVMVAFKLNEAYLDTYSASFLEKTAQQEDETQTSARYNIQVEPVDRHDGQFAIPLTQTVDAQNIYMHEDFLENKLVITLKGAASCVEAGSKITIDSDLMAAVGVYRQQENVVLELYCEDTYGYALTQENGMLTVSFKPLREQYAIVSVVYIPYQTRQRLSGQDIQALDKLAQQYNMKLFMTSGLENAYSEEEVIAFANALGADFVLGVDVAEGAQTQKITTLCNTEYFIPCFGSVELAAVATESFLHAYSVPEAAVEAADAGCALVNEATVPAVYVTLSTTQSASGRPEMEYDLNRKLLNAVTQTCQQTLSAYFTDAE